MLPAVIARNLLKQSGRLAAVCSRGMNEHFPDYYDTITGREKKEMDCRRAGNKDPYNIGPQDKGAGTAECPTLVPSVFDTRMVLCNCELDGEYVTYFWLHTNVPRQCKCGHWYKLYHKDVFEMPSKA